jgi:hypothetical protein
MLTGFSAYLPTWNVAYGSCVDDARITRRIWRVACGRVQVMCPAYLRGTMTAGPDVVRGSGPNHSHGP